MREWRIAAIISEKLQFGAGGENRTPVASLENSNINHYTTPALHILYHILD